MAKFLTTSAITYHLEHLLQNTTEQLIIVTPTFKFNERVQELLAQRDDAKATTHILYQQNHLQPTEMAWLNTLTHLRTSFCKNLQAQCYLNDSEAIITSLQLHGIGQQQHHEMGMLIHRDTDTELYQETYNEVQRLIKISEPVRLSVKLLTTTNQDAEVETAKPTAKSAIKSTPLEPPKASKNTVAQKSNKVDDKAKEEDAKQTASQPTDKPNDKVANKRDSKADEALTNAARDASEKHGKEATSATTETAPAKLTTAKLAKSLGLKTPELKVKLTELGYLEDIDGELLLSEAGRKMGGESRKGRFGEFCVWDAKLQI